MHYVYILYSRSTDKYYVGESEDVNARLKIHNSREFKGASTSFVTDWKICLIIKTTDRTAARRVEKFIKSMKSKRFISSLVTNNLYFENFKLLVFEKFSISDLD